MPNRNNENDEYKPNLDELISLRQAAKFSGISPNHLRLLVSKGEIWGKKIDHYWVTTEQAVREYLARDIRPGPKAKGSS